MSHNTKTTLRSISLGPAGSIPIAIENDRVNRNSFTNDKQTVWPGGYLEGGGGGGGAKGDDRGGGAADEEGVGERQVRLGVRPPAMTIIQEPSQTVLLKYWIVKMV